MLKRGSKSTPASPSFKTESAIELAKKRTLSKPHLDIPGVDLTSPTGHTGNSRHASFARSSQDLNAAAASAALKRGSTQSVKRSSIMSVKRSSIMSVQNESPSSNSNRTRMYMFPTLNSLQEQIN